MSASVSAARAVVSAVWIAIALFLPVGVLLFVAGSVIWGDAELVDFASYYRAAGALLNGVSPYPEYVYPPLAAIASIPLAFLPLRLAEAVLMLVLVVCVAMTLFVLRVRDWRCYGVAFLWPPVIAAIQTGNITIPLGLAAALAWRFRDRPIGASSSIGLSLAAKLFLWPLVVWLAATRRYLTAGLSLGAGLAFMTLSWAVIGFAGLSDYWNIVRGVQRIVEGDSLTVYVLAVDFGASQSLARAVWLASALGIVVGCVALGRRGNDRGAFILAVGAALALSPIVWLHYFALLLVVVAVARPTLAPVWFIPLAMYLTPGSGHATWLERATTLGIAALTIALAYRETRLAVQGEQEARDTRGGGLLEAA